MDKEEKIVRILLADDHPIFRHGLRGLLEGEPDFRVVGEAADGKEAVKLVRSLEPDILVLDLAMPQANGLEVLRQISGNSNHVRTILLTVAVEKRHILEALRLGARGVVLKDAAIKNVIKCIRTVLAGQYWVGRESVADISMYIRRLAPGIEEKESPFGLTPRELDIVAAIAAGSTNRDIAQRFALSEDTVKHHLTNIFDKLGVSTRLELAVFALHHGMTQQR